MRFTSLHIAIACSVSVVAASCGSSKSDTTATNTTQPPFNHEVPCDVAQVLANHCLKCHGDPPTQAAPESLVTYAQLMAPSATDPSQTEAQLALVRMQSSFSPMPPAGEARVTDAEIAAWSAWVNSGAPMGSCSGPGSTQGAGGAAGAGGSGDAGTGGSGGDATSQGGSGGDTQSQGGSAGTDGGGQGGTDATGGSAGSGGSGGSGGSTTMVTGLPCDIATFLATKCDGCHGTPPAQGTPTSMSSLEDLLAPSPSDPTKRVADVVLTRLTSTDTPMPPLPQMPATAAEIMAFQTWVTAGLPSGTCLPATSGDGGDGGNPYGSSPICTSGKTWPGTTASSTMGPGEPCLKCHKLNGAFLPAFGGTVYPTAHEPDDCYGINGQSTFKGTTVSVTDSNGKTFTTSVNSGGNFYMTTQSAPGFKPPYTAKVTHNGAVRQMVTKATSADCNACHTQDGTTNVTSPPNSPKAPGRILVP